MRVAFFTLFEDLDNINPIVSVVESHISMLTDKEYDITIFVKENFKEHNKKGFFLHKNIKWQRVINSINGTSFKKYDYSIEDSKIHKTFKQEVKIVTDDLILKLKGFEVCFMYDILTKGEFLVHNTAIREVSSVLKNLKFYYYYFEKSIIENRRESFVYPFSNMCKAFDNCFFITPTYERIEDISQLFNVPMGKCSVVFNSIGYMENMSKEIKVIHKFFNLFESEFLIIYPTFLETYEQCEKICMILGILEKKYNKSCKVVFVDFEKDTSILNQDRYKAIIKNFSENFGFDLNHILFTSDINFNKGLSDEGIIELFSLSNLYINASKTIDDLKYLFYATGGGNILVLNENIRCFKEFGEGFDFIKLNTNYYKNGTENIVEYESNEFEYLTNLCNDILKKYDRENFIKNKRKIYQNYNKAWIYYNQLEPLLKR
ncbi:MAG: hypothetical protein ACK5LY_01580 [Lachnospirales bacterium]